MEGAYILTNFFDMRTAWDARQEPPFAYQNLCEYLRWASLGSRHMYTVRLR